MDLDDGHLLEQIDYLNKKPPFRMADRLLFK